MEKCLLGEPCFFQTCDFECINSLRLFNQVFVDHLAELVKHSLDLGSASLRFGRGVFSLDKAGLGAEVGHDVGGVIDLLLYRKQWSKGVLPVTSSSIPHQEEIGEEICSRHDGVLIKLLDSLLPEYGLVDGEVARVATGVAGEHDVGRVGHDVHLAALGGHVATAAKHFHGSGDDGCAKEARLATSNQEQEEHKALIGMTCRSTIIFWELQFSAKVSLQFL